jgi:hypothetical protein
MYAHKPRYFAWRYLDWPVVLKISCYDVLFFMIKISFPIAHVCTAAISLYQQKVTKIFVVIMYRDYMGRQLSKLQHLRFSRN